MSDGDQYDVCCMCGTERLVRTMHEVIASGLRVCIRCYDIDREERMLDEYPSDDE